jgi:hypothetical protein
MIDPDCPLIQSYADSPIHSRRRMWSEDQGVVFRNLVSPNTVERDKTASSVSRELGLLLVREISLHPDIVSLKIA